VKTNEHKLHAVCTGNCPVTRCKPFIIRLHCFHTISGARSAGTHGDAIEHKLHAVCTGNCPVTQCKPFIIRLHCFHTISGARSAVTRGDAIEFIHIQVLSSCLRGHGLKARGSIPSYVINFTVLNRKKQEM
jgi:hypothetical protein